MSTTTHGQITIICLAVSCLAERGIEVTKVTLQFICSVHFDKRSRGSERFMRSYPFDIPVLYCKCTVEQI
jgi:hypothetical protein